jgi:type I restriction enzyme S subunit
MKNKSCQNWRYERLSNIAEIRSGSVNPGNCPNETFELYSIPAFDNGAKPKRLPGRDIKSNKTIVEPGDCLFSKLNPRISRIWIVQPAEGYRQIASTEFLPIYSKLNDGVPWFLSEFLAYLFSWREFRERFVGHVEASTRSRERLKSAQVLQQIVPLPPLPVQERIVEILQKADEIRRKRKEALELADKILPALFLEMFGDPATNPKGWPIGPLSNLLDPAIQRQNPTKAFPEEEFIYIEIAGIRGFRIAEVKRIRGEEAPSRARQVVRAGDVLYSLTRPNLRNIAIVPDEYDGAICTTGFAVLRPKNLEDSLFIFEIVRSGHFTEAMSRLAEGKSLYPAVDENQVRSFPVIQPPALARAHFGKVISHLLDIDSAASNCSQISETLFSNLLSRAFSGELTAEWEAANAEWIAERQAFYERLPRLVILALLAEKAKRTGRAAATVLITALMKYVFLFQMEGNGGRRRLYHFVPYHYGPFAKELYTDLGKLHEEGLVQVESNPEEDKMKITITDQVRTEALLAELPEDLKEDAAAVISTYGDLDHNSLLEVVYEKYPTYAKKSRLRQRRA